MPKFNISTLKSLDVPVVVTVAYRITKGVSKKYSYCGAKYYYARKRLKDGVWTWRPLYDANTPDRRSPRLALKDATEKAALHKIELIEDIRLGTEI